jgi:peptidoglycan LD-endopeptidase CwlK
MYHLSPRSLKRLQGVDERLKQMVAIAIEITSIDFGVTSGLRTIDEQQKLVDQGKSQTLKSKHISGYAVDLVAYEGNKVTWELEPYGDIALAMRQAAFEVDAPVRWGGAWHIDDIRAWDDSMIFAMDEYVDKQKLKGRPTFIDAPHFELMSV